MRVARPSDHELAIFLDVSKLSYAQVAQICGAAESSVRVWASEMRKGRKEATEKRVSRARVSRSRAEIEDRAQRTLDAAYEILMDMNYFVSGNERIKQAQALMQLHKLHLEAIALTSEESTVPDRPELLARVREATASADGALH